jgi:hypothetical protein
MLQQPGRGRNNGACSFGLHPVFEQLSLGLGSWDLGVDRSGKDVLDRR